MAKSVRNVAWQEEKPDAPTKLWEKSLLCFYWAVSLFKILFPSCSWEKHFQRKVVKTYPNLLIDLINQHFLTSFSSENFLPSYRSSGPHQGSMNASFTEDSYPFILHLTHASVLRLPFAFSKGFSSLSTHKGQQQQVQTGNHYPVREMRQLIFLLRKSWSLLCISLSIEGELWFEWNLRKKPRYKRKICLSLYQEPALWRQCRGKQTVI